MEKKCWSKSTKDFYFIHSLVHSLNAVCVMLTRSAARKRAKLVNDEQAVSYILPQLPEYSVSIPMSVMMERPPSPMVQAPAPPIDPNPIVVLLPPPPVLPPLSVSSPSVSLSISPVSLSVSLPIPIPPIPIPSIPIPSIPIPPIPIPPIPLVLDLPELPSVNQETNPFKITLYWLKQHTRVEYHPSRDWNIRDKVGMNVSLLSKKLDDETLDHIHHRSLRRYLIDEMNRQELPSQPPQVLLDVPAQVQVQQQQQVPKSSSGVGLINCPILKMGYACVECKEKIQKNRVLDHLAGHVATLMKRVYELENDVKELKNGGKVEVVDLDNL